MEKTCVSNLHASGRLSRRVSTFVIQVGTVYVSQGCHRLRQTGEESGEAECPCRMTRVGPCSVKYGRSTLDHALLRGINSNQTRAMAFS